MKPAILLTALLVTGCATSRYDYAETYYPRSGYTGDYAGSYGARGGRTERSVDAARQVCSIESLTAARDEWRTEIRGGYRSSGEVRVESQSQVTERPYGPQTERLELVRAFETDLDAAYRFATSSCQAYSVCMDQQRYDERACRQSGQRWSEAQDRFEAMSARLADIRLEISDSGYGRPYRGYDRRYEGRVHDRGYRRTHDRRGRDRRDDCDGVLGDVFTTGECDHVHRDYGR